MIEAILAILAVAVAALVIVGAILARRAYQLMVSIECLCLNVGGLREQMRGEHEHPHA